MKYFDENKIYYNRDNFFPKMLYNKIPPNLILKLNDIGYDFFYSGNSEIQCMVHNYFSCVTDLTNINSDHFYYKIF